MTLTDRPKELVDTAQIDALNRRNRFRILTTVLLAVGFLALGAWFMLGVTSESDPTASDEYAALEQELAKTELSLAEVTVERDRMMADIEGAASRYEKAKATQETVLAVIGDPSGFGTEEEVLDLLDELAIPDVRSGDLAFGGVRTGIWRTGWRNTLFSGTDATVRTWRAWLSDDGSVGGSLWTWSGTARNGQPFDLQGLELSRYNDDGLITETIMLYPYEDTEVHQRFNEGN